MEIHAPFAGIVRYHVQTGVEVTLGQTLATVEATKLEAPVVAPGPGRVGELIQEDFSPVSGGDALLDLKEI